VSPLHSMRRPPEFTHYAEYSGMKGRTEYRLFMSGDLHIFHQSREMEISLWESSHRNLARIVRYSPMRAMPYQHATKWPRRWYIKGANTLAVHYEWRYGRCWRCVMGILKIFNTFPLITVVKLKVWVAVRCCPGNFIYSGTDNNYDW